MDWEKKYKQEIQPYKDNQGNKHTFKQLKTFLIFSSEDLESLQMKDEATNKATTKHYKPTKSYYKSSQ